MKRFDYIDYKNHPYILSEINGDKATISGIFYYEPYGNLCVTELDVKLDQIKLSDINYDECVLGRLRVFRMINDTIFGFAEEELCRIHYF